MKRAITAAASGFLFLSGIGAAKADVVYTAIYSGANERPTPNASAGTAIGTFTYETAKNDFLYTVTFSGLSANALAAHIHVGGINGTGPIILPFAAPPSATSGTFSGVLTNASLINQGTTALTDLAQVNAQGLAGNLYANLHSTLYPAGEIRGQLVASVPEPATLSILGAALCVAVTFGLRRKSDI